MSIGLERKAPRGARTLLVVVCLWAQSLYADHYAGATISYNCLGGNFYTVYLDLYLNCAGVAVSAQKLKFRSSCGVFFTQNSIPLQLTEEVSPVCPSQIGCTTCNGGALPGFRRYRFATNVFLSPCNNWTMSWSICCRNSTENLSSTPGTYAEATLDNTGGFCDNSPRFSDNGVPFLCVRDPVSYNPGASDPNGHQMQFSLISARYDSVTAVVYQPGYTGALPLPGIIINSFTGQLDFTPTVSGNYVLVIQVDTYNSSGQLIGSVMRDLMFVIQPCDGSPPIPAATISNTTGTGTFGPSSVALCAGQSFCADLVVTDANPTSVITMTSNASTLLPGSTFTVIGSNPATGRLCWTASGATLPVNVFIDITDGSCPIENTASRTIYVASCLLLPIELLSFTATSEGSGVVTEWATASETRNDHFTVERSSDGIVFYAVGRVDAVGESNTVQRYSLKDEFPLPGLNYYRLRQTDTDGATSFSDMVPVDLGPKIPFQAVFDGSSGWTVTGLPTHSNWALTDALGRTVSASTIESNSPIHVDAGTDKSGMLLFTAWSGALVRSLKLPGTATAGDVVAGRDLP